MDHEMEPQEAAAEWAATPEVLHEAAACAEEVCELIRFDSRDSKLTLLGDFEAFGCLPEWIAPADAHAAIVEAFGGEGEATPAGSPGSSAAAPNAGDAVRSSGNQPEAPAGECDPEAPTPAGALADNASSQPDVAANDSQAAAGVAQPTPRSVFCAALLAQNASDIALIAGKEPRFFSRDFMTNAYAHWAALSADGDDAATFAYCVREDSRVYPRPMIDTSLDNPPFNLAPARLAELFAAVNGMPGFEDIRTTSASNGDVYYYSTDYLTPGYAASLAEWYSVEQLEF